MAIGKGGPNYWYTEDDARRACEGALRGARFLVTVSPNHHFLFVVGARTVGAQWISEESEFGTGLVAHITMSVDKLTIMPKDKSLDNCQALLDVKNLHYTVRSKADSVWLEANIKQVEADQRSKLNSAVVQQYQRIQQNSVHRGLTGNGNWNSGNKDNNQSALTSLNFTVNGPLFPGDLHAVKGEICTVGTAALMNKEFSHGKDKKLVKLKTTSAAVVVS